MAVTLRTLKFQRKQEKQQKHISPIYKPLSNTPI